MELKNELKRKSNIIYHKEVNELKASELHNVIALTVIDYIGEDWYKNTLKQDKRKCAYYLSAEFLMGRAVFNNLNNVGILEEVRKALKSYDIDINELEEIKDAALGNGGLGRLAACFLESAATSNLFLNGYGIKYKFGLFQQYFENGYQKETADDWNCDFDPWFIRREDDRCLIEFADQKLYAVPYDMPIIPYKSSNINTLRLWQSEPVSKFDFQTFNNENFEDALQEKNKADIITCVLYPNDNQEEGKVLRLKQQYFFSSASLNDILKRFKKQNKNYDKLPDFAIIQLNDTHPVISIPELIRLLMKEGLSFENSFEIAKKTFAYTNHTIMEEALEKWDVKLIKSILPEIYSIIENINKKLLSEIKGNKEIERFKIIYKNQIHMARLAVYVSDKVNGVAKIHTEILKANTFSNWYSLYKDKFVNETNGVTPRRWLSLCNPELEKLIIQTTGEQDLLTNLTKISKVKDFADDNAFINKYIKIKQQNKRNLSDYIYKKEGIRIPENFVFDIQIKRIHEYKRQLLNALSVYYIYNELKQGKLTDFQPTAFIFGGKSAPGYYRAKGIIKYINSLAKLINNDKKVNDKMMVVFIHDYNVSYAEKLMVAANISEQISTAGTEASGTGNMKLMMNGAVTLGTMDGANVEIVEQAGLENNYIFGASVEEINNIKESYDSLEYYNQDKKLKKAVDSLISKELSLDKCEETKEVYNSLLKDYSYHKRDQYFVLYDFNSYINKKLQAINDYKDEKMFFKKCILNTAGSGIFSSDRTVKSYAKDIWKI